MIKTKWKISPFNDFIFKKIFGTVGNEELLKAFRNAVMKDKNLPLIAEVTIIEKLEFEKNHYEEKLGIIDIHAKTEKGEVINVEVQLCNEYNIDKRTLFYWSKKMSLLTQVAIFKIKEESSLGMIRSLDIKSYWPH